jgi:hypothetical protein
VIKGFLVCKRLLRTTAARRMTTCPAKISFLFLFGVPRGHLMSAVSGHSLLKCASFECRRELHAPCPIQHPAPSTKASLLLKASAMCKKGLPQERARAHVLLLLLPAPRQRQRAGPPARSTAWAWGWAGSW